MLHLWYSLLIDVWSRYLDAISDRAGWRIRLIGYKETAIECYFIINSMIYIYGVTLMKMVLSME